VHCLFGFWQGDLSILEISCGLLGLYTYDRNGMQLVHTMGSIHLLQFGCLMYSFSFQLSYSCIIAPCHIVQLRQCET